MSLDPEQPKSQQEINQVTNDTDDSECLSEKLELSNLKKQLQAANREILSDYYRLHREEVDTMNQIARYTAHHVHKNRVNGDARLERIFEKNVLQHKLAGKVKNREELNLFLHDIINFDTLLSPDEIPDNQQVEITSNSDSAKVSEEQKECLKSDKGVVSSSGRKRQVKRTKKKSADDECVPKKKRKQVENPVAVTKLMPKRGLKAKEKDSLFVADARKADSKKKGAKPCQVNLIIGNSSYACKELSSDAEVEVDANGEYVAPAEFSHQWLVYVKDHPDHPNMLHLIDSVQFFLHDSYKDSSPIVKSKEGLKKGDPLFSVENMGWGEFEVIVVITFKSDLLKQVEHRHDLRLYSGPDVKVSQYFDTHVKVLLPFDFPHNKDETSTSDLFPQKSVVKDLFAEDSEANVEESCEGKIDISVNNEDNEGLDETLQALNEDYESIQDIMGQAESVNSFTGDCENSQ